MNKFPRKLLWIIALSIFLLNSGSASAQTKSVEVLRRNATITIQEDGDVKFVETWQVQFSGGSFTFAFRSIPVRDGESISAWGVSEENVFYSQSNYGDAASTYVLSDEGGEKKITWYFSPAFNETRTFQLSYTLSGSLGIFEEGDRFFWKFVEADRQYTIDSSSVQVILPVDFSPDQLELAGYVNAREELFTDGRGRSNGQIVDAHTVQFNGGPFYEGDLWEIGVRFPHGIVNSQIPAWQIQEARAPFYGFFALLGSFILTVGGGLGLYLLWYTRGRDRQVGVRPEFIPRPPEDLPPGMVGTLLDEKADLQDVLATLVDLARKGYLKFVEKEEPAIGKQMDFEILRQGGELKDLRPYEARLMQALLGSKDSRELSDLKNKFYKALPEIRGKLYTELVERKFFEADPEKVRNRYGLTGCFATLALSCAAFFLFGLVSAYTPLALCLSISLIIFPLGLMFIGRAMPRKSAPGARSAAQWAAFKNYLANIEKYTSLDTAREQFDQYLPYAIAFGIEKSWVAKFSEVDTPVPIWYLPFPHHVPSRSRGPASQAPGGGKAPSLDSAAGGAFRGLESMSTGLFTMLNSASSIFTSVPASSGSSSSSGGGFSGGGFSGGGGGGGGSSGFG